MPKIKVRAKEGLKVFFPLEVAAAPGRRVKILEGAEVLEVEANTRFVQRRIVVGDLVRCDVVPSKPKAEKPKTKPAAKPRRMDTE
jgi:hypothetical protein